MQCVMMLSDVGELLLYCAGLQNSACEMLIRIRNSTTCFPEQCYHPCG